ncbi:hypothetical protein [Nocardia mangyaensis]|nr:hypothetical protein [Nocardia mangyaensis]
MPDNNIQGSCRRQCPPDECYCAEPTYRDANSVCASCGGHDGDCYCDEF